VGHNLRGSLKGFDAPQRGSGLGAAYARRRMMESVVQEEHGAVAGTRSPSAALTPEDGARDGPASISPPAPLAEAERGPPPHSPRESAPPLSKPSSGELGTAAAARRRSPPDAWLLGLPVTLATAPAPGDLPPLAAAWEALIHAT
jgi:hypothetical protein